MVPNNWLNDSVALKNKKKNYIEVLKVLFSLLSIQLLPFLSLCLCFCFWNFYLEWETYGHVTCLPYSPQHKPLTIVKH